jgi:hypothetical protein
MGEPESGSVTKQSQAPFTRLALSHHALLYCMGVRGSVPCVFTLLTRSKILVGQVRDIHQARRL